MKRCVKASINGDCQSMGGLIGGEAKKVLKGHDKSPVCGERLSKAMAYAMGVMEVQCFNGTDCCSPYSRIFWCDSRCFSCGSGRRGII